MTLKTKIQEVVENINNGSFSNLNSTKQLQSLEDLRESVAESYRSYGKSYVKQYKAYFEEIEKNIYPVLNRLEEIFPNQKHNLLDIGSGPGEDLAFFQTLDNIKAVGLEPSEIFIDMCNKKEKDGYLLESSIFQGYAENMPFKDSEFHIVYAQRSLLHVPYVFHTAIGADKFFKESARVLKKKGLFYLTLREGDSGYIQKSTGRFFQGYNEEMIQSLADKNNFEILYFNKVTNERFPVGHWQKWLTVLLQLK